MKQSSGNDERRSENDDQAAQRFNQLVRAFRNLTIKVPAVPLAMGRVTQSPTVE